MKKGRLLYYSLIVCLVISLLSPQVLAFGYLDDNNLLSHTIALKETNGDNSSVKTTVLEDENITITEKLEEETALVKEQYDKIISEKLEQQKGINSIASTGNYRVAIANADGSFSVQGSNYTTFDDAKSNMNANSSNDAVVLDIGRNIGNQVVAMKSGIVVATADKVGNSTLTFNFPNSSLLTYINNGNDALYVDSSATTVIMNISGQMNVSIGIDKVELVPTIQGRQSYYIKTSSGDVVHYIVKYTYNISSNRYNSVYELTPSLFKAPSFMQEGTKYYSIDGVNYYTDGGFNNLAGTYYQYYKYLPFRSKTHYTVDELNSYIASWGRSDSVLNGKGQAFIDAQEQFGVNAVMLLAFAAHESGRGTSSICKDKNNLFGVNATDSNPYGDAMTFNSIEHSVFYQAEYMVSRKYLDANTDSRYFGSNLGNKKQGLNVKYASDPYWGEKIAGYVYRIEQYLGSKDNNKFQIAISNTVNNARKAPNASSGVYYKYSNKNDNSLPSGMPILITANSNGWYEVQSDMGICSAYIAPATFSTVYDFQRSKAYVATSDYELINLSLIHI